MSNEQTPFYKWNNEEQKREVPSWGSTLNGNSFRGLPGLNIENKYRRGIPEEISSLPGFHPMQYNSFVATYGKSLEEQGYNVNSSFVKNYIYDTVGEDTYNKYYKGKNIKERIALFKETYDTSKEAYANSRLDSLIRDNALVRLQKEKEEKDKLEEEQDKWYNEAIAPFMENKDSNKEENLPQSLFSFTKDNEDRSYPSDWGSGKFLLKNQENNLKDVPEFIKDIRDNQLKERAEAGREMQFFTEGEVSTLLEGSDYYKMFEEDTEDDLGYAKSNRRLTKKRKFKNALNSYAEDIMRKALTEDFSMEKYERVFDTLASQIDPYYKESLKYGEREEVKLENGTSSFFTHNIAPFCSQEEKFMLMSEFLAVSGMTGDSQVGFGWLQKKLLDLRGESVSDPELNKRIMSGIGADCASSILGLIGAALNSPNAISETSDQRNNPENYDFNPQELPGWQLFLYNLTDNPTTIYSKDLTETGIAPVNDASRARFQYYKENGLSQNDVSFNKPAQIIQQSGYTIASLLLGSYIFKGIPIIGKGVRFLTDAAAKGVFKKGLSELTKKTVERVASKAAYFLVGMPVMSYSEAALEGMGVYDRVLRDGKDKLEQSALKSFMEDIKYDPVTETFANADFDNFYRQNSPEKASYDRMIYEASNMGNRGIEYSQEFIDAENERLAAQANKVNDELKTVAEKYYNTVYKDLITSEEAQKRLKTSAISSTASDIAVNMVIISCTDMLFSNLLGPESAWLKRTLGITKNGRVRIKYVKGTDGLLHPTAMPVRYNAGAKIIQDFTSEFVEEGSQNIISDITSGVALNDLSNFIENETDPFETDRLGYGILHNWGTVASLFGESITSEETWEAAMMGGMGALFGAFKGDIHNTAGRVRDFKTNKARYSYNTVEKIAGAINTVWQNPITMHIEERRKHIAESNSIASSINSKIKEDPSFANALSSSIGYGTYITKFMDARDKDDKIGMEESDFGSLVEGALLLDQIAQTKHGKRFKQAVKEIKEASLDTPGIADSKEGEGDGLISLVRLDLNKEAASKTDQEVLDMVKDRIEKFETLQKDVSARLADIDSRFSGIDDITRRALVYTYLTQENKKKMIEKREGIIKKETAGLTTNTKESSSLTEAQRGAIARRGTLQEAIAQLSEAKKTKSLNKRELAELQEDIKILKTISDENAVLTSEEILELSPKERAAMLSSGAKYSSKQQEIIKGLKSKISKKALKAIKEVGAIQKTLDDNNAVISDIENSTANLGRIMSAVIGNVALANANKKLGYLREAKTYKEFEEKLNEEINSGRITTDESRMIGSVFSTGKSREFYTQFINTMYKKTVHKNITRNIPLKSISRNHRDIVRRVLEELINKSSGDVNNYTFGGALEILDSSEFKESVKKDGIIIDNISGEELNQIKQDIAEGVNIIKKAIQNFNSINSKFNDGESQPAAPKAPTKKNKNSVYNTELYAKNKEVYDELFAKIANIFTSIKLGKKDVPSLTSEEVFMICSLLDTQATTENIVAIDGKYNFKVKSSIINSGLTSLRSLNTLFKELSNTLSDKKILNNDTADVRAISQLSYGVSALRAMCIASKQSPIEVLGGIITQINPTLESAFDVTEIEKGKGKQINYAEIIQKSKDRKITFKLPNSGMLTEEESEFLEKHGAADNVIWINENIPDRRKVKLVLVVAPELIKKSEEYNGDNLPLVVAVECPEGTTHSKKIDGKNYLIVGIAGNSRSSVTEEANALFAVRTILGDYLKSNEVNDMMVVKSSDSSPIEFGGWNLIVKKEEAPSVGTNASRYLSNYIRETFGVSSEEEAMKIFKQNIVVVSRAYKKETDGVYLITSYVYKGRRYTQKNKVDNMPESAPQGSYLYFISPTLAFINPLDTAVNNSHNLLYLRWDLGGLSYRENPEAETKNLIQILTEDNIFDEKFKNSSMEFLYNMASRLKKDLKDKEKSLKNIRRSADDSAQRRAALEGISGLLSWDIGRWFNLDKIKGENANITFTSERTDKGNLKVTVKWGEEVLAISELNLESLNEESYEKFIRETVKGLLLSEIIDIETNEKFYRIRTYENSESGQTFDLVKYQIEFAYFDGTSINNKDIRERKGDALLEYFRSNILYTTQEWIPEAEVASTLLQPLGEDGKKGAPEGKKIPKEEGPKPFPQRQKQEGGTKNKNEAISIFEKHKLTNEGVSKAHKDGYIGVTSVLRIFENTLETDTEEALKESIQERIEGEENKSYDEHLQASTYGTCCDSIARLLWDRLANAAEDKSEEDIITSLADELAPSKDNGISIEHLPAGFETKAAVRDYIRALINFKKNFLDVRGETIVPFDLLFTATLNSEDGKFFLPLIAIPDIVTVDEEGGVHIYDMKTYRARDITSASAYPSFVEGNEVRIPTNDYFNSKMEKSYRDQLSLYAHIVEQSTGLTVKSVGILPVPLNYEKPTQTIVKSDENNLTKASDLKAGGIRLTFTPLNKQSIIYSPIPIERKAISQLNIDMWLRTTDDSNIKKAPIIEEKGEKVGEIIPESIPGAAVGRKGKIGFLDGLRGGAIHNSPVSKKDQEVETVCGNGGSKSAK